MLFGIKVVMVTKNVAISRTLLESIFPQFFWCIFSRAVSRPLRSVAFQLFRENIFPILRGRARLRLVLLVVLESSSSFSALCSALLFSFWKLTSLSKKFSSAWTLMCHFPDPSWVFCSSVNTFSPVQTLCLVSALVEMAPIYPPKILLFRKA